MDGECALVDDAALRLNLFHARYRYVDCIQGNLHDQNRIKTVNAAWLARRNTTLEPQSQVCCTCPMADEKKGSKDIILWIITVALVALAIFLYKR